jgi:hemolysin III
MPFVTTEAQYMSHIQKFPDHSLKTFLRRTVSAQLHLIGFLFALVGLFFLVHYADKNVNKYHFWSCLVFGLTSLGVFGVSTVYHVMSDGFKISDQLQKRMEDLDHFAIFLFIAGTYTPFIVNAIRAPWDYILLCLIWGIGIAGIIYTHFRPVLPQWARHRFVYTGIFVLMGWTLLIRLGEAFSYLSSLGIFLLVAGGLSYTFGAVIYATKWPDPFKDVFGFHEIWHIMVILGFGFHYFLILNFYLPLI